ncbi:hypothetical protein ITJ54_13555 [Curtobacterium sp. VKM Ac-2865]|uniref:hypothetical protein n=1 Tax=Curtobacterium sp. VKM Ac-2865 TaxID=2783817 RepID=UPI00188CBE9F|nr:hypothetical protein [Curtobacterium sp. VKM Ac-2865]MBF4583691.1 hypothetical protein [Curtobacterium sp. VKM Ac-2865]
MAPSPFRTTALVCGIVTASLGVGLLTPVAATAATTASPAPTAATAASPAPTASAPAGDASTNEYPEFADIPIDPSLPPLEVLQDWSTPYGSRVLAGYSNGDDIWLMMGDRVLDRTNWGAAFFLTVPNVYKDADLEVVRIHTAEDGTRTRSDRLPMPRGITVEGLERKNHFEPGVTPFAGSATSGATIVATDTGSGDELFTTTASTTRDGTGTWSAEAELSDAEHTITLTQTTPDGRKNELRDIRFTPGDADAPAAPTLDTNERRLNGDFVLTGQFDADTKSVVVEDEAGEKIATAALTVTGYVATIPQDRIGTTVYVVAHSEKGTPSTRTAAQLQQLPTDASVAAPSLRDVMVYPNGRVQVVGERDDAPGLWVLDGDRVVSGVLNKEGWSYTIPADETAKQIDIVNLSMDGTRYGATSERVHLPRLLKVEGVAEENTYEPGTHAFSGSAEAGATITATDQDGNELFSTEASGARSGVGSWSADADLASSAGYKVTFTQTTTDGRTSVMQDIAFAADEDATPRDLTLTSHQSGTFTPGNQRFTGTATPGATVTFNPAGFDPSNARYDLTTTANSTGAWTIERSLADSQYKNAAFRQDTAGDVIKQIKTTLTPEVKDATPRDLTLTSHQSGTFTPGNQRFTGTATPGATVTFNPAGFDPSNARYDLTTTANSTGAWTIERSLADWQYKDAAFRQDTAGDVIKQIKTTLTPEVKDATPRDLTLTSHQSGTFTPGNQRFAGTATPGATVTFNPAGFDPSNARYDLTTTANSTGAWTIERSLADWQYKDAAFRQDTAGDVVKQITTPLTPES